jgi:hypothetical protein
MQSPDLNLLEPVWSKLRCFIDGVVQGHYKILYHRSRRWWLRCGAPGGSGNLSSSLSNVARLAAHPKFVWIFNANYDGTT